MIIKSFVFQVYSMAVHGPDIMAPDTTPFATLYKYGKPLPNAQWTDQEKAIAAWAIAQAITHPRSITDPPDWSILPNLPATGYGRCEKCHQPYEGDACLRCFPI
jgi:hypothetical protein